MSIQFTEANDDSIFANRLQDGCDLNASFKESFTYSTALAYTLSVKQSDSSSGTELPSTLTDSIPSTLKA